MRHLNPMLHKIEEEPIGLYPASLEGVVSKVLFFLAFMIVGEVIVFMHSVYLEQIFFVIAIILVLVIPFIGMIHKQASLLLGSIYSVAQGIVLVNISLRYAFLLEGVIPIVLSISVVMFLLTVTSYATGLIEFEQRKQASIRLVLIGSVLVVGINAFLSFVTNNLIEVSLMGYIGSFLMVVVSSVNYVWNFDSIGLAIKEGKDQQLEWYCGFGFITTILWMYLSPLHLIIKKRKTDSFSK